VRRDYKRDDRLSLREQGGGIRKCRPVAGASADFLHGQELTLLYLESCGTASMPELQGFK